MSNYLKMDKKNLIITLKTLDWSLRRIEWETGLRRETIAKYVRRSDENAAISPTGSPEASAAKAAGRPSAARPYQQQIEEALQHGLSAQQHLYIALVSLSDNPI